MQQQEEDDKEEEIMRYQTPCNTSHNKISKSIPLGGDKG